MWDILSWLFYIALVAGLIVLAAFIVRGYLTTGSPTGAFFSPKLDRRLEVVDQASVDGRRRLVLVRRDDVEHLIMTGGPVDVVIETGINPPKRPQPHVDVIDHPSPVFSRAAPTLGKVVSES
jgi:flagellar protein FliO/FliZ